MRMRPELLTHVGKGSNRIEEVEAGLEHDPDKIYAEYADPKRDPSRTLVLREMLAAGLAVAASTPAASRLSATGAGSRTHGPARPSPGPRLTSRGPGQKRKASSRGWTMTSPHASLSSVHPDNGHVVATVEVHRWERTLDTGPAGDRWAPSRSPTSLTRSPLA